MFMRYCRNVATQANLAHPVAEQADVPLILVDRVSGTAVRLELYQELFERLFDVHPMLL